MENCAEFLEVLFACWAAGLCAVPVNARLHPDEVAHIARDSGARLLVATPGLAAVLAPLEEAVETLSPIIATDSARVECVVSIKPRFGDELRFSPPLPSPIGIALERFAVTVNRLGHAVSHVARDAGNFD